MKMHTDTEACTGQSVCVSIRPDIFEVGDDGLVHLLTEDFTEADREDLEDAVEPVPDPGPAAGRMSAPRLVVAGASLAGLRAVEAARRAGFDGPVTLLGAEPHLPYSRPPLSKEFLAAAAAPRFFRSEASLRGDLDVDLRLATPATALHTGERVAIAGGEQIGYTALVIATGAKARELPGMPRLAGVHTLRNLDDALAIRDALQRNDIRLRCGVAVESLAGTGSVQTVHLADGSTLPADVVYARTNGRIRTRRGYYSDVPTALVHIVEGWPALELQLTAAERAELDRVAGGSVRGIVRGLVDAVDPDTQARITADAADPAAAVQSLLDAAVRPIEASVDVLKDAYGVVDTSRARSIVQSWQAYLNEHRDEITAIQLLTEARERRISFADIKELAERIRRPPRNWTIDLIWAGTVPLRDLRPATAPHSTAPA